MKPLTFLAGVAAAMFGTGCCSSVYHEARNSDAETHVVETRTVKTKVVSAPPPTKVYFYGFFTGEPETVKVVKVTKVATVNGGPMEEEAYYDSITGTRLVRAPVEDVYMGGTTAPYSTITGGGGRTVTTTTTRAPARVPEGQEYLYGTTIPYTSNIGGGSTTTTTTTTWTSSAAQGQVPPTQNNPMNHGAGLFYDKLYFDN